MSMKRLLLLSALFFMWLQPTLAQDLVWSFAADWWINKVHTTSDVNNNGMQDVLVGASDNRLYCVEGGGASKGTILWSTTFTGDVWDCVSIGDVNNDGIDDAIAGTADNTVYCISGDPAQDGAELWSFTNSGDDTCVAEINDVDDDGIHDCVAGSNDDHVYCISGADGTEIWSYQTGSTVCDVARAGDVNNDGYDDVFAVSLDDKTYCLSGKKNETGNRVIWATTTGDVRCVDMIGDVNKDGINDCLSGGLNDKVTCLSGANGNIAWTFTAGASIHSVKSIDDVNGDGKPDCIAGAADNKAYGIAGNDGSKLWETTFDGDVWAVAAIPDVNNDGVMDCVAGTGNNDLAVISGASSGTGGVVWLQKFSGDVLTVSALNDVTGNGIVEVMGGSNDSYVRTYEGNSTITPVELVSFSATIDNDNIHLQWTTASEIENYGYTIERSEDNVNYKPIGFVPGNGTNNNSAAFGFTDEHINPGDYYYRLLQTDYNGTIEILDTLHVNYNVPVTFQVVNNYPNPFNAGTVIAFTVPNEGKVNVLIYNIRGELITTLYDGQIQSGYHALHWDGKNQNGLPVASGVYICSVRYGNTTKTLQMSYVR